MGSLVDSWHEPDFKAMQNDGNDTYHVMFEGDDEPRRTSITVIAYLARLDPDAQIVESE